MTITVIAGGVGAARLLSGMTQVAPPSEITAVVNVGDDLELHGLHISPDIDTIIYTLGGGVDAGRGWGLAGETWGAMESLTRYDPEGAWFSLGDRDLGAHLYRTGRLDQGATLSMVTAEMASSWGLELAILPVTDDRLRTMLTLATVEQGDAAQRNGAAGSMTPGSAKQAPTTPVESAQGEISFQEYFVGRRHAVAVSSVRFEGADSAKPAPGVIEAIDTADLVVIAPSNPIVSVAPVLAAPGVRSALEARRDRAVAVSPIVAGAALKGPAARLMAELGHEPSVVGVARLYAPVVSTLIVDEADAALAGAVEAEGVRCVVAPAIMHDPAAAAALARAVVSAL